MNRFYGWVGDESMLTEMREAAAGLSRHDEQGKLSLDEPIGPHSGRYQVQG